jgi:RimJ/RimL family protein N-acetyltransferase
VGTFTELLTPRLRLRRMEERDLPALVAYRGDPEVARYQSWGAVDETRLRAFIADLRDAEPWSPGGFQIAVALRESDALIGDCYFTLLPEDRRQAEIGYTLGRAAQGQGYASEAVRALLGYAFDTLALHRVAARAAAANAPSVALLERLGLRREGLFRQSFWRDGVWLDEVLYAVLAEEWRERQ